MIAAGNARKETEIPAALPGDEQAGKFAYLAGGLGGANLVTLGLMYAIEVPRNGPYWSALRNALFAVGGTLSGAAWVGWPVWYPLIGRSLSRAGKQSAPGSMRVAESPAQ